MKKESKARRKKDFIKITKSKEVCRDVICKKMGINLHYLQQLIFDMRKDGHEIWMINKGGRDDNRYYKYIGGPSVVMPTKDRMIDMMRKGYQSAEQMSSMLYREVSTIRTALNGIKSEYEIETMTKGNNVSYYKIIGERKC